MNENTAALFAGNRTTLSDYAAEHFGWSVTSGVGTITLNRPERKNPLTFESYAELRDLFRQLAYATDVHVIVIYGAGGNFCSGGDVHDIIAAGRPAHARVADVHAHDGRPCQGDAPLSAAGDRGG
jgi:enoyl-CoA hydratase/carnithine racemase